MQPLFRTIRCNRPLNFTATQTIQSRRRLPIQTRIPNRSFAVAPAKTDLLKALREEIQSENKKIKESESKEKLSKFKIEKDEASEVVMTHELKGYKIKVSFDPSLLDFDEEDDDEEEEDDEAGDLEFDTDTLPIEIQITPVDADFGILVNGELEVDFDDQLDAPFFTPQSVVAGPLDTLNADGYSPDMSSLSESFLDPFAEWLADFEIDQDLFDHILEIAENRETRVRIEWLKNIEKVVKAGKEKKQENKLT
jgi:hypothetical protein